MTLTLLLVVITGSIWKPLNIWISALQVIMTVLTITIIQFLFTVALIFINTELDKEQISRLNWVLNGLCVLILLSAIYIGYQLKKIVTKPNKNNI